MDFKIDIEKNCLELQIGQEVYLRILKTAIRQSEQDMRDLEQAFSSRDIPVIQSISHRLKGDYANLRVRDLSAAARQLNDESKGGQNMENMLKMFSEFKSSFECLCRTVNRLGGIDGEMPS